MLKIDDMQLAAIILTVAHDEFKELGVEKIREFGKKPMFYLT